MRWTLPLVFALVAAASSSAAAKDAPYPAGRSVQTLGARQFELIVPEGAAPERGFSLLLAIDTDGKQVASDFASLAKDGFVVCSPSKVHAGGGWATSEAKELLDLIDHLQSALPINKRRLHVLTNEIFGFATFVAFDKRVQTVSYTLAQVSTARGKPPPDAAKKQTAVLSLWHGAPDHGFDGKDVLKTYAGKVRTLEWRPETTSYPYFRYWILVADDQFTPGFDLSFDWMEDEATPSSPKPADKPGAPKEAPLERAKREAAAKHGALVYFFTAGDASKPEAKAVQNDTFFRTDVREAVAGLVAVKLDRSKNEAAFASFGLKSTPAVVVLDASFAPVGQLEGAIEAKALLAALHKAASPPPKAK